MVPRCFYQFFEGGILCFFQRPDFDVARSLADASEQVMLVVEPRPEQEAKCDMVLHRRNVADTPERRIAKRVVDGVIVKELVRSRQRLSYHLAQLQAYPPYFIRIVRKKLFNNISQRQSTPIC